MGPGKRMPPEDRKRDRAALLGIFPTKKAYLDFKEDDPAVVIFFAGADVLAGLFTLANFDEADPEAVRVAGTDAPEGWSVVQGKVEDSLRALLPAHLVLLNPPRRGLHERIPRELRQAGVSRIIYVSCNPATLARDLKRLGEGYRMDHLEAFDLFPQTAHVECVAHFTRLEP